MYTDTNGYIIYVIALGIPLVLTLIALIMISVMFMCFCIRNKRSRIHSKPQSEFPIIIDA